MNFRRTLQSGGGGGGRGGGSKIWALSNRNGGSGAKAAYFLLRYGTGGERERRQSERERAARTPDEKHWEDFLFGDGFDGLRVARVIDLLGRENVVE